MSVDYGDPRLPQRFWDKVYPEPNTGCWLWGGTELRGGYGQINYAKKNWPAHRLSHHVLVSPAIKGMDIDHLCRVRCCVNPAHLEQVTRSVNCLRGKDFGKANREKTHCKHGHEFNLENTFYQNGGSRACRTCRSLRESKRVRN